MTAALSIENDLVQLARTAVAEEAYNSAQERRLGALRWITAHGFPTGKDEDWRYLPPSAILPRSLDRPDATTAYEASVEAVDHLVPDLGGPRVVLVDGYFAAAASTLSKLPDGLTVEVTGATANTAPSGSPATYRHAFEALNEALGDGITVRLDPGTLLREPIHLAYLTSRSGEPRLSSPRVVVVAGAGSQLHLVESFVGRASALGLTNSVTAVHIGEDAHISIDRVQDESADRVHLSLVDIQQQPHSRLSLRSLALGARAARHEVRVRLAGEGADAQLEGLFIPRGTQRHDHPVLVEHAAPHTRSRQRYQGIADNDAHGVFNGRIVVALEAHGSDAEQTNRNLLLSDRAEIDTRPRLEIFNDDVRCTHGATVGRLDQAAIYYLRSRGIPLVEARAMLIHAVVDQIVDRLQPDALRTHVAGRLASIIDDQSDAR